MKDHVKELLKTFGVYQHWPVQNGMGKPTLDAVCCHRGRYFAIETKAPGAKPTTRQGQTISEIREAGGKTFVIDGDLKELTEWLAKVSMLGE